MTEDNMESQQNEFGNLVLPENGVTDLTDKLTEYMTEIELGGVPDILGQVLDDFIDQAGRMGILRWPPWEHHGGKGALQSLGQAHEVVDGPDVVLHEYPKALRVPETFMKRVLQQCLPFVA